MRNRVVFWIGFFALLLIVLLGCSLGRGGSARITPTPTKTPRPIFTATMTPTASPSPTETPIPTDTPVSEATPTDTPIPPTDTPVSEATPTDIPVAPTDTPTPTDTPLPAPTNTSPPKPTNTPAPTNTPKPPEVDFRIKEIVPFVDGSVGQTGYHNIYFTVIDASGQPLSNIILASPDTRPDIEVITGLKGSGKAEFTMVYEDYYFQVTSDTAGRTYTSEVTHRLSMIPGNYWWPDAIAAGICSSEADCQAFGPMHFSYNITFQRTW